LARISEFPKLSARASSIPDGKELGSVDLDSSLGTPTLLGFMSPDRLLVRWEKGQFGLEVEDTRAHKHARRIELPGYDPSPANWAISADGRFFATGSRVDGKHVVTVYPLYEGRGRQLAVNSLDPNKEIRPSGLAFSADGNRLSALFVQGGSALVASWNARTGATLPDVTITAVVQPLETPPAGPAGAAAPNNGTPNSLSYVGNAALLVGGTLLVSAADGQPLAELGITGAFAQGVVNDSTVYVAFRDGPRPVGLLTIAFDPKRLPATGGAGRTTPARPPAPAPKPPALR
jgi:hypothetical protein